MRKIIGAFAIISMLCMFTSCSSVESDAKKLADLQCRAMKDPKDAASIQKEALELSNKLKDKYTSEDDKKKFGEAFNKALAECK